AEVLAVDAGLYGAAQRFADDDRGSRGSVHAGVLSDSVYGWRVRGLPVHVLGLAVGFEGEGIGGQWVIELDVGVETGPGLALALVEDLLEADRLLGINPDGDLGE